MIKCNHLFLKQIRIDKVHKISLRDECYDILFKSMKMKTQFNFLLNESSSTLDNI